MPALFIILGFIVIIPLTSIYYGWAISTLWNWFIVPLGVMEIGTAHAIGISCLLGLFLSTKANQPDKNLYMTIGLSPVIAVIYGAIIKGWFM